MTPEGLSQATDAAVRAWTAQLIEAPRTTFARRGKLERQRFRESMALPEDLEFDALDFGAVVKHTKENDDD